MIEAKLDVVFKEGLPESLGISDSKIRWFNNSVKLDTNDKKQTKVIKGGGKDGRKSQISAENGGFSLGASVPTSKTKNTCFIIKLNFCLY